MPALLHMSRPSCFCLSPDVSHMGLNRSRASDHLAHLLQIAAPFDVEQLQRQYPATYQESMNTVLVQEAMRYNALLEVVAASLKECAKAVKGLVVMSPSLEAVSDSMYDNQVSDAPTQQCRGLLCFDTKAVHELTVGMCTLRPCQQASLVYEPSCM